MTSTRRLRPRGLRRRLRRGMGSLQLAAGLLLTPALGVPAVAQDMPLPMNQQLLLFGRILSFDQELMADPPREFTVAVAAQDGFPESARARDLFLIDADGNLEQIQDVPVHKVSLDASDLETLTAELDETDVDVIYFAPLRSVDVAAFVALARERGIRTISGVPDYLDLGVAVALGERGGTPDLLVNEEGAAAVGMDFQDRFLRLARVR